MAIDMVFFFPFTVGNKVGVLLSRAKQFSLYLLLHATAVLCLRPGCAGGVGAEGAGLLRAALPEELAI